MAEWSSIERRRDAMSIEKLYQQFPDVHPNIVLKTEILRKGIDIVKCIKTKTPSMDSDFCSGCSL